MSTTNLDWSDSFSFDPQALGNATQSDGSIQLVVGVGTQTGSLQGISKIVAQYGGEVVDSIKIGSLESLVVAVLKNRASLLAGQLQQSGFTRYVELNVRCYEDAVPNDANYTVQWGLQKIGADYAWNTTVGNHSILVAIIDPVDYNHPDLAPNYVPLGWDWAENDSYPMDTSGHGTHCAGILAAVTNNSIGIAGVAQVRIMAEDWTGNAEIGGWIGGLARSLIHATDAGAKIISCSAGTYYESDLIREAANYATSHGVLVFASAGNYGMNIRWYPAAYDGVEAVASTDINDTVASSSNYGEYMDVAAPGVNIYSTLPNNKYGYMSGTSMACPMAAGVAALIWSQYPNMSTEGIRYQLERTCKDLGDPGIDIHYGYGRVDARNAIETPYPTHELIVKTTSANSGSSMTSPGLQVGQTRQINATVYNCGLSNETNVVLNILIDGTIVHSEAIPNFASGASYKCQYNWTPTAEAVYNVTIATSHLQGETSYANNVVASLIGVSAKVALISDSSSGLGPYLVPLLDAMHVNYDLYQSNYGYYTGNLTFLQSYNAVIFYKDSRNITEAEQTALNSYLASGGNLLVAGGNALSSTVDLRLADVIRSLPSSIKTNQSDLYSASSTHSIMNGPFGVFPAGFRIRNLIGEYSHHSYTDLVYANTSRGARAVATTGDGGAKILATDSLPGKVVFWNGNADNWLIDNCRTIFKNIVAWLTDNAPPATTNDYDVNWHNQNFTINLSATDYFTVKETYYKINNGTTKTLSEDGQPKITNESANNTLEYWSIDYSLNQENHHSLTQIKLDKTSPTANAGNSKLVTLGDSVTFSGEASSDANGITSYRWVLGDGTQVNGSKVTHTFASIGTFTAVLTVQDPASNSGTETVWVIVNDKPATTVTPTPAATTTPTATPTPTATLTVNPTSTSAPNTSSGALPEWTWIATLAAVAVLCGVTGTVLFKQKRTR